MKLTGILSPVWVLLVLMLSSCYAQFVPGQHVVELSQLSLAAEDHVLRVVNSDPSTVFGGPEREFWTLLVLTLTLPEHGCGPCASLKHVVARVARSWFADHADTNMLFFVEVDLVDRTNLELFAQLELKTIPHVWLIPPSKSADELETAVDWRTAPHAVWQLPDLDAASQALDMAQFLSQSLQKPILLRQEDQVSSFITTFGVTLGAIILLKKRGPRFLTNLRKTDVYKVLTLVVLIACVCGYSFTTIERVPFIAKNEASEVIYISGGQHYQFGIEIVIVGLNYVVLGATFISLIWVGQYRVREGGAINTEAQKAGVVVMNALALYLSYACLTSIVLRKDHDYPFHLVKLF